MNKGKNENVLSKGCGLPGSHQRRKHKKMSSTKGRDKSNTCKADKGKRFFARSSRSYKDPQYSTYLTRMRRERADAKSSDTK